jgi:hypothetical protein
MRAKDERPIILVTGNKQALQFNYFSAVYFKKIQDEGRVLYIVKL